MGFLRRKSKKDKEAKAARNQREAAGAPTPVTPVTGKPSKTPTTPLTQPIRENGGYESSGELKKQQQPTEETPVKKLLEDLNLLPTTEDVDGMEMVLGAVPEPTHVPYNPDNLPPREEEEEEEESTDETSQVDVSREESRDTSRDTSRGISESPLDAKETDPYVDDYDDDNIQVQCDGPEDVSRKLLQVFHCADLAEQVGDFLPPSLLKMVPTSCQPYINAKPKRGLERESSYYNEQFAIKFLDEILNVGYALVYHQPISDGEDWVGRSVTLVLRPGICNDQEIVQPKLEFATMGGGKRNEVETRSVGLLDIHSIATSPNAEEMRDDMEDNDNNEEADDDDDELQCFFTMTTTDGEVHVLEVITPDESRRLVVGIKNLSARLSSQLIAGDPRALADFYDNQREPLEIRFSPDEAMVRLSHSFLD